jgi:hypothetical protein
MGEASTIEPATTIASTNNQCAVEIAVGAPL